MSSNNGYEVDEAKGKFKRVQFTKINSMTSSPVQEYLGYRLALCSRTENRLDDIYGDYNEFGTGLIIRIPVGYHGVITGTDTLVDCGYQMPFPLIITSEDCDREIVVKLQKTLDKPYLDLPLMCLRLVIYKSTNMYSEEVNRQPVASNNNNRQPNPTRQPTQNNNGASSSTASPASWLGGGGQGSSSGFY